MSVIIGAVAPGGNGYLAADSLLIHSGIKGSDNSVKILRSDYFAVAVAGDFRATFAMRSAMTELGFLYKEGVNNGADPGENGWVLVRLVNGLREALKQDGFTSRADPGDSWTWSGTMILATNYGVWGLGSDFSLVRATHENPIAYGSGSEFALGAMTIARQQGMSTEVMLRCGVSVAARYSTSCGGLFHHVVAPGLSAGVTVPKELSPIMGDSLLVFP